MNLVSFLLLGASIVSLWVRRDPKIWGTLLGGAIFAGIAGGLVLVPGAIWLFAWGILWSHFEKQQRSPLWFFLLATLIVVSFGFKLHFFPGFKTIALSPKFILGVDVPVMEFFPLALLVPLASSRRDWGLVLKEGVPLSVIGIGIMAALAVASGTVHWQYKLPSFPLERYAANFFLTAPLEEGFYRGFVQNELVRFFSHQKWGKILALVLGSLIFTLAHTFWSPNLGVQAFVFLAGLLYGGVYLISGKIESAIFCHFLLNFIHMTFFSYHAM